MLSDLNRVYQSEFCNVYPVEYALKGPSMPVDVLSHMLEDVLDTWERNHANVISTSSDGQWHSYGVRDRDGKPLTIHQLAKDHWRITNGIDKSRMISIFRDTYVVKTLDDIKLKRSWGQLIVEGHMSHPSAFDDTHADTPKDQSDDDEIQCDGIGCFDWDFIDEIDDDTLHKIDEVVVSGHVQTDTVTQLPLSNNEEETFILNDRTGCKKCDPQHPTLHIFDESEEAICSLNQQLERFNFSNGTECSIDRDENELEERDVLSEAFRVLSDDSVIAPMTFVLLVWILTWLTIQYLYRKMVPFRVNQTLPSPNRTLHFLLEPIKPGF